MSPRDVQRTFIEAARGGRLVRLTEAGSRTRLAEPYMVFRTSAGKTLLHMYQLEGYSSHGKPRDWKNAEPARFVAAEVVDTPYSPRPDYNPLNRTMFPRVLYAAPNANGKQRAPDAE